MTESEEFLKALYGDKPDGTLILLWERLETTKLSYWCKTWEEAAATVADHHVNLYAGTGLSSKDWGSHRRCPAAKVAGLVSLTADVDIAGPAHKSKIYPVTREEAKWIFEEPFQPTLIVDSGNGLQPWWLLKETEMFATDTERTHAAEVAKRWHLYLIGRAAEKGWKIDSTFDLARIYRVPGTINRKPDIPDTHARIIFRGGPRYNLSDFDEFLPPLAREAVAAVPAVQPAAAEGGGWIYSPNAEIDPELYEALRANSLKFCATWDRRRADINAKDHSQSSYDQSLANMLMGAGVADQDIVDTLVHHRRLGGSPPKDGPLYYYGRTLERARNRIKPKEAHESATAAA